MQMGGGGDGRGGWGGRSATKTYLYINKQVDKYYEVLLTFFELTNPLRTEGTKDFQSQDYCCLWLPKKTIEFDIQISI